MKKEIEITQLIHYFVRGRLNDKDLDKLFAYLHEDPGLLEFILIDSMIYQHGLRRQKIRSYLHLN